MKRRKNWKRKRRLQLFVSVFLCIGIISVLSIHFVLQLHAEKEKKSQVFRGVEEDKDEAEETIGKVKSILQNPELPTGCEATAAAMLLNAYGYHTDKIAVAEYLEKSNKIERDGKVYAPHPDEAFIGNPNTLQGYGAFPNVVAKAMQKIIDRRDGKYEACALYGKTEEELLAIVDEGKPICIWSSMDNLEIEYRKGWNLIRDGEYTDDYFYWPSNEHVLVLNGYGEKSVTVCDPLKGVCSYPRESFFRHYEQVGKYAIMMEMRK